MNTKKLWAGFLGAAAVMFGVGVQALEITGAGATFPYPIYAKWAEAYKAKTGVGMNYQSIGSGGGIKQIQNKTVDFGASDMPLKPEELDKDGLMQFPTVIGGDRAGRQSRGREARRAQADRARPGGYLPGQDHQVERPGHRRAQPWRQASRSDITVVHRSDGSGTTFIWVNYLSKMSPEWKEKVGEGTSVAWPEGVGGKGNEGVASYVQRIKGSIGYVEYAYALQNKMTYAQVQNRAGQLRQPVDETFKAAAAGADWSKAPGYYLVLTDQPGKDAWPISGATFILMYKTQDKPERAKEVLKFFDWAYSPDGDKLADSLDYVPLPDVVTKQIRGTWKAQIKDASGKPVY